MVLDLRGFLDRICQAPTRSALAGAIARALADSRSVALARVWYREPTGDLRLAGSAGTPSGGGSYSRLDGEFSIIPAHVGKIAAIAAAGRPAIVRGIRGDEGWLVNKSWAARQGIRAFVGWPMIADDDVIGVTALFDRELVDDAAIDKVLIALKVAAYRVRALGERETLVERLAELESRTSIAPAEAHPSAAAAMGTPPAGILNESTEVDRPSRSILTRAEIRRLERANIEAALQRSHGKVFGPDGAAALLGMKPTTLASKMTVFGLRKPRRL